MVGIIVTLLLPREMAASTHTEPPQADGAPSAAAATAATAATHYDSLNVPPTATYEEIKAAFHRLARMKHPDRQVSGVGNRQGEEAEPDRGDDDDDDDDGSSDFRRIQAAWEVLRDASRRDEYDQGLQQRHLREGSRRSGALTIHLDDDDVAEAIDPDTDERFYVYQCRCGEEVYIDGDAMDGTAGGSSGDDATYVDCPGCCFVYRVVGIA